MLLGVGKLTSGFGRTATGVVDLVAKFRGMRAAKTALDDTSLASKALTSAIGGTTGITEKAAGGFSLFGKALTTGGESAGILGTALTPVGATVLGVTAAVGAGVAVWELWGKGVYESSERTKRWGSDIGSDADQAASKFSSFETKASAALDNTAEGASQNAKKISEAFDDMAKSAEDSVQKQHDAAEKIAKDVGGDAGAAIENKLTKKNQRTISVLVT